MTNTNMNNIQRYDVYQYSRGRLPVVVVADDHNSPLVKVVPLTFDVGEGHLPTQVLLFVDGPSAIGLALCEHVMTVKRRCLTRRIGRISEPLDCSTLVHALYTQLGMAA